MARTKTNTQNNTKNTKNIKTQQPFREKNYFCVFMIVLFSFDLLFIISLMISPGNVDLPPWYGQ